MTFGGCRLPVRVAHLDIQKLEKVLATMGCIATFSVPFERKTILWQRFVN
jgi:hypothetical protein